MEPPRHLGKYRPGVFNRKALSSCEQYPVQIWDLFRGNGPFDPAQCGASRFSEEMHLPCIISLLGPPPLDILQRGEESSRYLDDEGTYQTY